MSTGNCSECGGNCSVGKCIERAKKASRRSWLLWGGVVFVMLVVISIRTGEELASPTDPKHGSSIAQGATAYTDTVNWLQLLRSRHERADAPSPEPSTASASPAASPSATPSAPPAFQRPPLLDPCGLYQTQRAIDSLGTVIARQQMRFGENIHVQTRGCRYFPDEEVVRADLLVNWQGNNRTNYAVSGTLDIRGDRWDWREAEQNQALVDVNRGYDRAKRDLAIGGAIIGGLLLWERLSATPAKPKKTGNALVCLWNDDHRTMHIEYQWAGESEWGRVEIAPKDGFRWVHQAHDTVRIRREGFEQIWRLPGVRLENSEEHECHNSANYATLVHGTSWSVYPLAVP